MLNLVPKKILCFDIIAKFVDMKTTRVNICFSMIVLLTLGFVGCGGRATQTNVGQDTKQKSSYTFRLPQIPPTLQGDAAKEYLRRHIWDGFDFTDTLQLAQLDERMMIQAFAYYVATISENQPKEPMLAIMQHAATSKPMLEYFVNLAEKVLHDPNSPARSDEKYIPVLEYLLASPLLDEYEKMPYESDLHVARQNRVGHQANDFVYTTANGKKGKMSGLKADYTIIFISNPGCPMCREIKQQIEQSALLGGMIDNGSLKILVIYPDEDLVAWREHLGDYPQKWINAYDDGQKITHSCLYDLRAIPALYLLDEQKRVMAKDCTNVSYIEKLIADTKVL